MKQLWFVVLTLIFAVALCGAAPTFAQQKKSSALPASAAAPATSAKIDRTVLPIAEPKYPSVTELDARNVKAAAALRGQGAGRARRTC